MCETITLLRVTTSLCLINLHNGSLGITMIYIRPGSCPDAAEPIVGIHNWHV